MNDLSKLIRQAGILNNPGDAYFNSFLPHYKMYRKAKIRKQILVVIAVILLASSVFVVINNF